MGPTRLFFVNPNLGKDGLSCDNLLPHQNLGAGANWKINIHSTAEPYQTHTLTNPNARATVTSDTGNLYPTTRPTTLLESPGGDRCYAKGNIAATTLVNNITSTHIGKEALERQRRKTSNLPAEELVEGADPLFFRTSEGWSAITLAVHLCVVDPQKKHVYHFSSGRGDVMCVSLQGVRT